MSHNPHFGAGLGPSPVRRVPMPKFEFALEKFLRDRRKRPKDEVAPLPVADSPGAAMTAAGRFPRAF